MYSPCQTAPSAYLFVSSGTGTTVQLAASKRETLVAVNTNAIGTMKCCYLMLDVEVLQAISKRIHYGIGASPQPRSSSLLGSAIRLWAWTERIGGRLFTHRFSDNPYDR